MILPVFFYLDLVYEDAISRAVFSCISYMKTLEHLRN